MDSKTLTYSDLMSVKPALMPKFAPNYKRAAQGIYFLFNAEMQVVYIGYSLNILRRVQAHLSKKQIVFTDYSVLEVSGIQTVGVFLNYLEAFFIARFMPIRNISKTKHTEGVCSEQEYNNKMLYIKAQREFLSKHPNCRNKNNWI